MRVPPYKASEKKCTIQMGLLSRREKRWPSTGRKNGRVRGSDAPIATWTPGRSELGVVLVSGRFGFGGRRVFGIGDLFLGEQGRPLVGLGADHGFAGLGLDVGFLG